MNPFVVIVVFLCTFYCIAGLFFPLASEISVLSKYVLSRETFFVSLRMGWYHDFLVRLPLQYLQFFPRRYSPLLNLPHRVCFWSVCLRLRTSMALSARYAVCVLSPFRVLFSLFCSSAAFSMFEGRRPPSCVDCRLVFPMPAFENIMAFSALGHGPRTPHPLSRLLKNGDFSQHIFFQ